MMSAVVAAILAAGPVAGAEEDDPERAVDSSPVSETTVDEPESPNPATYQDDKVRHQAYQVGVMMIGGILIAGVGLMALVMIWGNRMRRIARQPLPTVAPRDELWYLRNKKPDQTKGPGESPVADEAGE